MTMPAALLDLSTSADFATSPTLPMNKKQLCMHMICSVVPRASAVQWSGGDHPRQSQELAEGSQGTGQHTLDRSLTHSLA